MSESIASRRLGAYLVLHSAGRWSDVFRLSAPAGAVLGRSSANQIVLRSDQASRRHARVHWVDPPSEQIRVTDQLTGWEIEDLASRNGVLLNGKRIEASTPLRHDDVISIAGFAITFTNQIDAAIASRDVESPAPHLTDDQLTIEIDPSLITDRRRQSQYLHGGSSTSSSELGGGSLPLLQLAFELAREGDPTSAIDTTLERITDQISVDTAGVYLRSDESSTTKQPGEMLLISTRQTGSRSYRRPPESLLAAVAADDGQATLARNVRGDIELATENNRGEVEVESLILCRFAARVSRYWACCI